MSTKKRKVKFRSDVTKERLQELLEQLSEAVEAGIVQVRSGGEQVRLHPGSDIRLDFEARTEPEEESLSIHLRWTPVPEGALRISGAGPYPPRGYRVSGDPESKARPSREWASAFVAERDARLGSTTSSGMGVEPEQSLVPAELSTRDILARAADHWTLQELYAKAQEVEVEGRSGLHKEELIQALLDHDQSPLEWPMEEVREKVRKAEIRGRSEMGRQEMIEALAEVQIDSE